MVEVPVFKIKSENIPKIQKLESGENRVEWNIHFRNTVAKDAIDNLVKLISINGLAAQCLSAGSDSLQVQYQFAGDLAHPIYWDAAIRNLLVIENEIGPIVSIQGLRREDWKLAFLTVEMSGGFDIDKTNLMTAAERGDHEFLKELLRGASLEEVNKTTPTGKTALHYAIHRGGAASVELLLQAGAAANVSGEITPIEYAATMDLDILKLLAANGAEINFRSFYGGTALMTAAARGNTEMVLWLLENGADKDLKNVFDESAADKALKTGHDEIVTLLT